MKHIYLITFLVTWFGFANNHVDTIPKPNFLKSWVKLPVKSSVLDSAKFNTNKFKTFISGVFHGKKKTNSIDTLQEIINGAKISNWKKDYTPSILLTQTSFVNWSKGGNNTIAGIASFVANQNYKQGHLFWNNKTTFKYGLSKEESTMARKTDDLLDFKSSFGYKTNQTSLWFYGGEFNLTTQFGEGYSASDKLQTTRISNFFSPARFRLGVGANCNTFNEKFKIYLSPITDQTTVVLDQALADKGAFGVDPAVKDVNGNVIRKGKNVNIEFGALVRVDLVTRVMENVNFSLKSTFYSDYLHKFGNVDVDSEMGIVMKVNQYLQATLNSHVLYDDDAKITNKDNQIIGPRLQLKQITGIGISYTF